MDHTKDLLERALAVKPAAQWARDLAVDPSTIAQAKRRKKLSPPLAGVMAQELNEDVDHWIAVAAIEDQEETPLLDRLRKRWRKR